MGRANEKPAKPNSSEITAESSMEKRRHWLASMRCMAPLRRATMAVTDTFRLMMMASTIILGWLVRPTAAMAPAPSAETMMVSMTPTRPTSTASSVEGQAMRKAVV